MKTLFNRAVITGTSIASAFAATAASAQSVGNNPFQNSKTQLGNVGSAAGISTSRTLPEIVGTIINVVLGFMGIVLLFYIILAGWEWMNSGGDSKGADAAKSRIKNAVIGLVIIISAYAISNFVVTQLSTIAT